MLPHAIVLCRSSSFADVAVYVLRSYCFADANSLNSIANPDPFKSNIVYGTTAVTTTSACVGVFVGVLYMFR